MVDCLESVKSERVFTRTERHSPSYPATWTESQRLAAYNALTDEQRKALKQACETPNDFWQAVDHIYDFQIDVCASQENTCCGVWINAKADSLAAHVRWLTSINFSAWCNPGFANALPWHQKAFQQAQQHPNAIVAVISIPGASQEWYHFATTHAAEIIDLADRVQYYVPWPITQTSNPRESVLYIYRRKPVPTYPPARYTWDWKATLKTIQEGN